MLLPTCVSSLQLLSNPDSKLESPSYFGEVILGELGVLGVNSDIGFWTFGIVPSLLSKVVTPFSGIGGGGGNLKLKRRSNGLLSLAMNILTVIMVKQYS